MLWPKASLESLNQKPKHYSYEELRGVVFNFIEIWYNRQRLYSTLDYRTPAEMQQYLIQQQLAA